MLVEVAPAYSLRKENHRNCTRRRSILVEGLSGVTHVAE